MAGGQSKPLKIWVNGTFDVIHRGHIELLRYASKMGQVRVGLDYDERVKNFKGDDRPINTWNDRKFLIESLVFVDSVVGFGSDEELENEVKVWGPKYIIVGSDYRDKKVIGSQYCEQVLFFDRIGNYSSTNIIRNEKNLSGR
jgi:D-beta-D-heptose 7-phosphate kinase/D-beta-D-heptose 1-phosphate adenosyltransferase